MNRNLLFLSILLATGVALADDAPAAKKTVPDAPGAKARSEESGGLGMSILGNQEAPKALVIVPWKSSELGKPIGISTMLDDSRQPIDKEVFMRVLGYYELMSTTTHPLGAPAGGRTAAAESDAAQPATAAPRRKS